MGEDWKDLNNGQYPTFDTEVELDLSVESAYIKAFYSEEFDDFYNDAHCTIPITRWRYIGE